MGDGLGVVVGETKGLLDPGGPCEDVSGELSAFAEESLLLLVGGLEGSVDLLVLRSESVKGLVSVEAGEDFLELLL